MIVFLRSHGRDASAEPVPTALDPRAYRDLPIECGASAGAVLAALFN